jgi:hypothetical protein
MPARTLLVVGIHREELAFGAAVAADVDRDRVDVLTITDGLSGRRPRADQRFLFDTLHRALYLQLLPHVLERHERVIDLHTGLDSRGPCADLYSRDAPRLAGLLENAGELRPAPRLVSLLPGKAGPCAETSVPAEIWRNPRFLYVGMEIYLREPGEGRAADRAYARALIEALSPAGRERRPRASAP